MILKNDCKYFPNDRPCIYHKSFGIKCDNCKYYSPVGFKILIIKLDAIGDVLRTTSILPSLKQKYPESNIYWLTKNNAKDIFINNNLVDEVLIYDDFSSFYRLKSEKFDLLINLDPSLVSSSIASFCNADEKFGFGINQKGKVYPFNPEAQEWFEMGAFDDRKKSNKKSYQQIIHEICKLNYNKPEIIINLTKEDLIFKKQFLEENNIDEKNIILGINPGSSSRWQFKKWHKKKYAELINKIVNNFDFKILLFGSNEEYELLKELSNIHRNVINTGINNSLRKFITLVDISDIFITGDTLGLHIATALKKRIICLFGPTSYNEIEDYDRILKIYPDMTCLVCYKNTCDFVPNCMDLIHVDVVFEAFLNLKSKFEK